MSATLREQLDVAVRAAGGPANQGLDEDGTWSTVLPVRGGTLVPATVRLSLSGRYFTMVAPLAALDGPPDSDVLAGLLGRHADADRTDGAAYSLVSVDGGDAIVAVYHWVLPTISTEQFAGLLVTFAAAVRGLHADLADLQDAGAPVVMLDDAWESR